MFESYCLTELGSQEAYKQEVWQTDSWRLARRHVKPPGIGTFYMSIRSSGLFWDSPWWIQKGYLVAEIWELVCLHGSDTRQWQPHSSRTQRGITFHETHNSRMFYMPPKTKFISVHIMSSITNYNDVRFLICMFHFLKQMQSCIAVRWTQLHHMHLFLADPCVNCLEKSVKRFTQ